MQVDLSAATLVMTLSFCALIVVVVFLWGNAFIAVFVDSAANPDIIAIGKQFLWIVAPFYPVVCFKTIMDGVLRGVGDMIEFAATTFFDLILRVAFSFILVKLMGFTGICWAFSIGWVGGTALSLFFFLWGRWKKFIPKLKADPTRADSTATMQ